MRETSYRGALCAHQPTPPGTLQHDSFVVLAGSFTEASHGDAVMTHFQLRFAQSRLDSRALSSNTILLSEPGPNFIVRRLFWCCASLEWYRWSSRRLSVRSDTSTAVISLCFSRQGHCRRIVWRLRVDLHAGMFRHKLPLSNQFLLT